MKLWFREEWKGKWQGFRRQNCATFFSLLSHEKKKLVRFVLDAAVGCVFPNSIKDHCLWSKNVKRKKKWKVRMKRGWSHTPHQVKYHKMMYWIFIEHSWVVRVRQEAASLRTSIISMKKKFDFAFFDRQTVIVIMIISIEHSDGPNVRTVDVLQVFPSNW